MDTAPLLTYGSRRRTRWLRWAIVATTVVGIALAVKRYGPVVGRQIDLLRRQRACTRYGPPADAVVYSRLGNAPHPARPVFSLPMDVTVTLCELLPRGRERMPEWFVGGLRNARGERLVVAYISTDDLGGYGLHGSVIEAATVVQPAGLTTGPTVVWEGGMVPTSRGPGTRPVIDSEDSTAAIAVGAGRRDPAIPSDFVAAYTINGHHGTIRGHLGDDDQVTLHDESADGLWQQIEVDRGGRSAAN